MKFYKFYADWCGPCRVLTTILNKTQIEYEPINVDNNEELVKRLGIRSFPTFLVFQNGREMERFSGFRKKEDLMNILIKYIKHLVLKKTY